MPERTSERSIVLHVLGAEILEVEEASLTPEMSERSEQSVADGRRKVCRASAQVSVLLERERNTKISHYRFSSKQRRLDAALVVGRREG